MGDLMAIRQCYYKGVLSKLQSLILGQSDPEIALPQLAF